jgi:ribosomal protein S18 acetylase RimI-like enzyme
MIKGLLEPDIPMAYSIVKRVVQHLNSQNINQWDQVYPTFDTIRCDILSGNAFGYFLDGELSGFVVLDNWFPVEYNSLKWMVTPENSLVVHRLSVAPELQGKGIGKKLMGYALKFAGENGYKSVRLDAFTENPAALRLYESLGYDKIGTVGLRKGEFNCYEKLV